MSDLLKTQFWIEVDTQIADNPTWRSVFQAEAERKARDHGYADLGEVQISPSDGTGKAILFWEVK